MIGIGCHRRNTFTPLLQNGYMRKGKIHHSIEMNDKKLELRHDRHTVSLLTDHMVLTPKYRGKILTGEVAFITEGVIRATCAEMSI